MSKYTIELRYLIENGYDLGLNDYEIFSEEYRNNLNTKIKKHYYFNEIGFETPDRFKFAINVKMREIMPYYNQLLKSELLQINPLLSFSKTSSQNRTLDMKTDQVKASNTNQNKTIEQKTTGTQNNTSEATNTGTLTDNQTENTTSKQSVDNTEDIISKEKQSNSQTNNNKNLHSDTPQSLVTDANLNDNVYITNADIVTGNTTTSNDIQKDDSKNSSTNLDSKNSLTKNQTQNTSNTQNVTNNTTLADTLKNDENGNVTQSETGNMTQNNKEVNVITENGHEVPLTELLMKYRETFLNVDLKIINELYDLFMLVY